MFITQFVIIFYQLHSRFDHSRNAPLIIHNSKIIFIFTIISLNIQLLILPIFTIGRKTIKQFLSMPHLCYPSDCQQKQHFPISKLLR